MENRSRVADRHNVIAPIAGDLLDPADHASGNEPRSGVKMARLVLAAYENFDVSATDIDRQDLHDLTGLLERGALHRDHTHQVVPRLYKRLGSFILKPGGQGIDVDAGLGELR